MEPRDMLADRIITFRDRFVTYNRGLLLLSIAVQLVLGLFFGHYYDMRIFMATGYLVGTGQNPYVPQNLTAVFSNNSFQGMTTVGYPPPWPLLLGLLYRIVYAVFPNLLVYNLAIKIPIIIANLGLAYLVAEILKNLGVEAATIRRAWIFLLFSPFLLYFASAWGQFDSIVALLSLSSLVVLHAGKIKTSALLLALAISFKPIALPILPVALVYLMGKSLRQAINYFVCFFTGVILFCVVPFIIFGWDPSPIFRGWNAHFTVGGGMSFMTFLELLKGSYSLPGQWWLLGLAWVPALGIGILALRPGLKGFVDLLKKSTALILIFFLTRTWLSEPNVILILPFVLILTSIGELDSLALAVVWILPLIFTIFNTSPPQLLFPSFPEAMANLLKLAEDFRYARLAARIAVVIPWQIAGWWIVITLFRRSSAPANPSRKDQFLWR
jgi:hypothetical protein